MNMSLKGFQRSRQFKKDENLYELIYYKDRYLRPREVRALIEEGIRHGWETLHDIPDEFVDRLLIVLNKPAPKDTQTEIAF